MEIFGGKKRRVDKVMMRYWFSGKEVKEKICHEIKTYFWSRQSDKTFVFGKTSKENIHYLYISIYNDH